MRGQSCSAWIRAARQDQNRAIVRMGKRRQYSRSSAEQYRLRQQCRFAIPDRCVDRAPEMDQVQERVLPGSARCAAGESITALHLLIQIAIITSTKDALSMHFSRTKMTPALAGLTGLIAMFAAGF